MFFFNDTATTEIYTLSLHDALPISDGRPLFPKAELVLHQAELAFWHDDAAMARAEEANRERNFLAGRPQVAPYKARTRTHAGGEVFPGVTAMPFPGHTPGHSGYMVASDGDSLLIWGDIVHVPEVQVPRPEVTMAFDVDPARAEATRRRVFEMVWADKQAFTGMHLHFPGPSRLSRRHGVCAVLPEACSAAF